MAHEMERENSIMKPPLHLLLAAPAAAPERRCCDDHPTPRIERPAPAWPVRWTRKLRVAFPASLRVFRRQIAQPAGPLVASGTPVVSSTGRPVGTVRDVVLVLGSGRAAYAVSSGEPTEGRVLLLPREAVNAGRDGAIVEERVLKGLERRIA
jgi:hypothetical protein